MVWIVPRTCPPAKFVNTCVESILCGVFMGLFLMPTGLFFMLMGLFCVILGLVCVIIGLLCGS